jgi:hypothetical protein
MSLINARNFIAPLSNKMAMGALVVGIIIIAVVRISGAHSNRQSSSAGEDEMQASAANEADMKEEIRAFLEKQEAVDDVRAGLGRTARPPAGGGATTSLEEDPFLAGLIEQEILPKKKAPAPTAPKREDGLTDIKKTLGLE